MPSLAEITAKISVDDSEVSRLDDAGRKVDDLGKKGESAGRSMQAVGIGMAALGAAGIAGIGSAINVAAEFEAALSAIGAVGGAAAQQSMADIEAAALRMGAETAFSASQAAAGMEELIKAGVPVPDVLDGAAQSALDLAAATGISVPEAAAQMAVALNVFGDTLHFDTMAEKAENVADVIARVSAASATGASEIGAAFGNAAPVAKMFGISMEELAMGIGVMSNSGIAGAEAGTMLKSMLLALNTPTKAQNEAMHALGLTYDDFFDSAGNLVGIEDMFKVISDSVNGTTLSSRELDEALATIFGSYGITGAATFFDTQEEGWATMRAGMDEAGSAQEQAMARLDNLKGAGEALGGSLETLAIVLGTALIPAMRIGVEAITALVNMFLGLPQPVQEAVAIVGALASVLTVGLGGAILIVPKLLEFTSAMNSLGVASKLAGVAFGPLGIALAAIGLAVVAYQTNFLGFADAVNLVAGNVMSVLQPALTALQGIVTTITGTFQNFVAAGFTPVQAAVAALSTAFPALTGAFQTAGALVENFITTLQRIGEGLALVISGLANWDLGTVLQGFFAIADAVITGFIANLTIIGTGIIAAFTGIDWGAVSGALQAGLQAASDAILAWIGEQGAAILAGFNAIDWAGLAAPVAAAWEAVKSAVSTKAEEAKAAALSAFTSMQTAIVQSVEALATTVIERWEAIRTDVQTKVSELQALVSETWETLKTDVITKTDELKTMAIAAFEALKTEATAKVDELRTAATTAIDGLKTSAVEAFEALRSEAVAKAESLRSETVEKIESLKTEAITKAGELKDGFITALDEMVTEAATKAGEIKAAIIDVFANAGTWLVEAGKSIGQGLINGIGAMRDEVANAAGSLASSAVDSAKGLLRIQSPSKVFEEIGQDVGQGMADGIRSKRAEARAAARELAASAKAAYRDAIAEIAQAGRDAADSFWQGMLSRAPETIEAAAFIAAQAVNAAQTAIDRITAHRGGAQLQIEVLQNRLDDLKSQRDSAASGGGVTVDPELAARAAEMAQLAANVPSWDPQYARIQQESAALQQQLADMQQQANAGLGAGAAVDAEIAQIEQQIAAMTSQFNHEQIAMTNAAQAESSKRIQQLQKEIAKANDPAKRQALKAELALEQQRLGLLDQLEAAQIELANAGSLAGQEIANIKIDAITAQLDGLKGIDVPGMFASIATSIASVGTAAKDAGKKVKDSIGSASEVAGDKIKGIGRKAVETEPVVADSARRMGRSLDLNVGEAGAKAGKKAADGMAIAIKSGELMFVKVVAESVEAATVNGVKIGKDFERVATTMIDAAGNKTREVSKSFEQATGQVVSNAIQAGQKDADRGGNQIGSNIGIGLVKGIRDHIRQAGSAGADIAREAIRAARAAANANSPSQEARELGHDWGDGFVLGMDERRRDAARSAAAMIPSGAGTEDGGRRTGVAAHGGGETVIHNHWHVNATFGDGEDWDRFFTSRERASRLAGSRG